MSTIKTAEKKNTQVMNTPLFSKENYMWMLAGLAVLAIGFFLMAGGKSADPKIFDEKEVTDISTFEKPHAYSKGFRYVIVNGVLTVEKEKHNGIRAGKALYGPGYQKH